MKLIIKKNKRKFHPKWKMPTFESEEGEFNRYSFSDQDLEKIKSSFTIKNVIDLNDAIWKKLNNTDSWDIKNMEDALRLCKEYGKSCDYIMKALETGSSLDYPIILKQGGKYELIGGNTRLMFCKAMNIVPKVLIIKL